MAVNNQAYAFLDTLRKEYEHTSIAQTARLLFHEMCSTWKIDPTTMPGRTLSSSKNAEYLVQNRVDKISDTLLSELYGLLKVKNAVDETATKANIPISTIINTPVNDYPFQGSTIKEALLSKAATPTAICKLLQPQKI